MLEMSTGYRLDAEMGASWVLRLEGKLQGEWVHELRRQWQRLRAPDDATQICVELDDVEFVDRSGQLLLAEMHAAGVHVVWHDGRNGAALNVLDPDPRAVRRV